MNENVAAEASGDVQVIHRNGGWCWYQGPRAIVTRDGMIVFTTISGSDGHGREAGDLWATAHQLSTGETEHFKLHGRFERDDHDVAGLHERPDGNVLAVYGKHASDQMMRWRRTVSPGAFDDWTDEHTMDVGTGYTYSNLYRLPAESGRLYNFSRTIARNPNCTISDDAGETWRHGWRLFCWERSDFVDDPKYSGIDGARPYVRYTSNRHDTIHFVTTEDHPRAYDNSIYHGFYRDGRLHSSDGAVLSTVTEGESTCALTPQSFTRVFVGSAQRIAWTVDLCLDADALPRTLFSVRVNDGDARGRPDAASKGDDLRYWYARFDGVRWHSHEIAHAGTRLFPRETDYTGLAAIDPGDTNVVVISTNAHPVSGEPLISSTDGQRHWELWRGRTDDDGASWSWQALTADSTFDNLRPLIPSSEDGVRHILWTSGKLNNFEDYELDVCLKNELREPADQRA
ncbi:MAG: BNR-4 repeat-containing protein [Planctomycetota bacterium]